MTPMENLISTLTERSKFAGIFRDSAVTARLHRILICGCRSDGCLRTRESRHEVKMVQMFYYENHGKCCKNLWKHDGKKLKVYLHAEESWAETASHSHWMVKSSWWRPKKLIVEEVMGTKRRSGVAKMIDNGKGVLWIRGKFKDNLPNPFFKLTLTSHVSNEDFQLGYSMSGHVERSFEKYISFQITHLAFVRRKDFAQQQLDNPANTNNSSKSNKAATIVKNLCRVYLSSSSK